MSKNIIQLNEEAVKGELKEMVGCFAFGMVSFSALAGVSGISPSFTACLNVDCRTVR